MRGTVHTGHSFQRALGDRFHGTGQVMIGAATVQVVAQWRRVKALHCGSSVACEIKAIGRVSGLEQAMEQAKRVLAPTGR